jgi:hypothetical protein
VGQGEIIGFLLQPPETTSAFSLQPSAWRASEAETLADPVDPKEKIGA